MSRSVVLAVDPATTSGFAILYSRGLHDYRLLEYGVVKESESFSLGSEMEAVVRRAIEESNRLGVRVDVVIEDQFLHLNPDTLKKVARVSGGWRYIAELCGVKSSSIIFLQPGEWQSSSLNVKKVKGKATRTELKKAAQKLVESVYNGLDVSQDEADAICLGRYFATRSYIVEGGSIDNTEGSDDVSVDGERDVGSQPPCHRVRPSCKVVRLRGERRNKKSGSVSA